MVTAGEGEERGRGGVRRFLSAPRRHGEEWAQV